MSHCFDKGSLKWGGGDGKVVYLKDVTESNLFFCDIYPKIKQVCQLYLFIFRRILIFIIFYKMYNMYKYFVLETHKFRQNQHRKHEALNLVRKLSNCSPLQS